MCLAPLPFFATLEGENEITTENFEANSHSSWSMYSCRHTVFLFSKNKTYTLYQLNPVKREKM